jgi:hypothetical protein
MGAEIERSSNFNQIAEVCSEAGCLEGTLDSLADALGQPSNPKIAATNSGLIVLPLKQGESNAAEARECLQFAIEVASNQSAKSW